MPTVDPIPARARARLDELIARIEAVVAVAGAGCSVADLCARWKVGPDKVNGFIRRGELAAVNVATNTLGRPQWRVTPEAVATFERGRTSAPPPKPPKRRRRADEVDYFPDK